MKTNPILTLAVLAILAISCSRELAEPQGGPAQVREVEMNVYLPDASAKTSLGSKEDNGYPTLWSEGDMISLNGIISKALTAEAAGRSTASFLFKGDIRYPYNILYPATDKVDKVAFPAVQQYTPRTFDPAAVPMYSSSRSFENASMSHLSSLLKFSLTSAESVTLSQIQVTSMGGENLSGSFEMAVDEEGLFTGALIPEAGSVSASLSFGEQGVQLSSQQQEFFISIPHGTYSKGFTVLLITDDSKVMTLKFYTKDGEHIIAPAKVIEFETVEFAGQDSILLIRTVEDLQALGEKQGDYTEAVLVADLDFKDKEWTPLDEISITLNGAGHTLKALSAPLCKTLSGTVKDMSIEAEIDSKGAVAPFAEMLTGELSNCSSRGKVVLSSATATDNQYVAGLVARVASDGAVKDCINNAEVSVISKSKDIAYLYVGGCAAEHKGSLENVVNKGLVTVAAGVAPTTRLCVGGVAAIYTSGSISGVKNAAKVSVAGGTTATSGVFNFVGGVIGYNNVSSLDNTMLSNTSDSSVEYTVVSTALSPAIGGVVGYNTVKDGKLSGLVNNASVNVIFPAGIIAKPDIKIGGVAGYSYYSGVTELICENCVNKGDITTVGKLSATDAMKSGVQIGGILGRCQITGSSDGIQAFMTKCSNEGNITMNESDGSTYNFVGGIIGTYSVMSTTISGCSNSGNIIKNGNSAVAMFMGGIVGNIYRDGKSTSSISGCVNTGMIGMYDSSSVAEVAAGGIIGNASGIKDKAMTLVVSDCVNNGKIDRFNTGYKKECNSYAGGIIGTIGRRHQTTVEPYVNVTVSNCKNTAQIIFNQFSGFETFNENTTDISFTGGIVGLSYATNGYAHIICCENSGNILSTSGQHGGIIGFIRYNTIVRGEKTADGIRYTVNTGNVCDHNPSANGLAGSGFCIAGGIAGYLRDNGKIEYAYNSGSVSGSVNKGTEPCAGGIVGKYVTDKAVRYCKNRGNIRNYAKGSNALQYCGSISGTDAVNSSANCGVEYCGVGGRVHRASGWIILDDGGTYPYQNYIFRNTTVLNEDKTPIASYPEDVFYKGCVFWDGTSVLPWEKSDWVEPEA